MSSSLDKNTVELDLIRRRFPIHWIWVNWERMSLIFKIQFSFLHSMDNKTCLVIEVRTQFNLSDVRDKMFVAMNYRMANRVFF